MSQPAEHIQPICKALMSILKRQHASARSLLCTVVLSSCLLIITGCAAVDGSAIPELGISADAIKPRIGGNQEVLEATSAVERSHLQLIATNMVSTLVQIPSMQSGTVTLQVNDPKTAYGNAIVRALEDAGFGLQRVSADQGLNYVSYSKRLSETESGLVTDYDLTVGKLTLRREFSTVDALIFPSSLMSIDGTDSISTIELADEIFSEQGGNDDAFISGVQLEGEPNPDLQVRTVDIRDFEQLPQDRRTTQNDVISRARQHAFQSQAEQASPELDQYTKYRRTVLIFEDNNTQLLGDANKQAVRTLVRGFADDDIIMIRACLDADGRDTASMNRAFRVEQELLGFGIAPDDTYVAPCARASYRHSSDDSPAPVELVHYRPKT